ncbi:peptidase M24 family protein [Oceanobacillus zhaokaii]|uniref:Peptidase M24 family protein n=1 Tax=Oceanobacillus zhaokaii TaxID=2052660 RepID=A0A345PI74_9BACI|nr:Xaa-Pro peptidase family protein [Oceanobacillus zhaokaii]AXI09704.1 peptidase M24 family protein [Oceanobacillus zhaokaii]
MTTRMDSLLTEINKQQIESVLVTSKANFYYLSNYYTDPHERVIGVYISNKLDPILILPKMEAEDAKNAGWKNEMIGYYDHEDPWELLRSHLEKNGAAPASIALEQDHITLERYQAIKRILPNAEIFDAKEILANQRVIKTKKEYALLKQAAQLADFGVETGVKAITEGVTELELIAKIEYELKRQGVQEMSFSTMALSGIKTASPHGNPSNKKITAGDLVMFDLGVVFEGYCSDITRTVAFKSITDEQKNIYETVLAAEQNAIDISQLGTAVGNIDKAARSTIEQAGYGEYFTHRIGHGLGIETHEYPSMHGNNELALVEGMCFTIEPGIYIPNTGGVRIEDMIFTTEKGPEILTAYPKELQIIK